MTPRNAVAAFGIMVDSNALGTTVTVSSSEITPTGAITTAKLVIPEGVAIISDLPVVVYLNGRQTTSLSEPVRMRPKNKPWYRPQVGKRNRW